MMNQQMVDEAGNIWEVDASGNPVRFVGAQQQPQAPMPQPFTMGQRDPNKAIQTGLDIANTQGQIIQRGVDNQRNSNKDALDAAKAQRDALEWSATHNPDGSKKDENYGKATAGLEALVGQINRTQTLFNQGAGATSGLSSIWDYIPTEANAALDTAGASLSQQGLAAFRIPGQGNVSDRDAIMFDRANLPQAANRDAATEEQLRGLRARVDAEYKMRGLPLPKWEGANPNAYGQPNAVDPANQIRYLAPSNTNDGKVTGKSQMGMQVPGTAQGVRAMLAQGRTADEIVDWMRGHVKQSGEPAVVSPEQVRWIRKVVGERNQDPVAFSRKKIDWRSLDQVENPEKGDTTFLENVGMSPFGAGAISAANAVSAGMLDEVTNWTGGDGSMVQAVKDQSRAEHPIASLAGDVVGGTIGMLGVNRAIGAAGQGGARLSQWGGSIAGDAIYGAAYGAGENNDNRLGGAAIGGLAGAGGSYLGNKATGMFGRSLRGVSDPAVRYLTERGVPLSLGQVVGNTSKAGRVWNKLESLPYVGEMMGARRLDSKEGFNRLAFEDAAARYPGSSVPADIGEEGARQLGQIKNDAYTDALSGVRLTPDQQFASDLASLSARGQAHPTQSQAYASMMMDDIRPLFQNNELTGEGFQAARQTFQKAKKSFDNQPMGYQMQNVIGDTSAAFDDLLTRQAAGALPKYNAANDLNRHVSILNRAQFAAKNADDALISPAQLKTASYNNARKYSGEAQAAMGNYPFRELIENSENIIPSKIADSGTAGRAAAMAMPYAIGGSAAYGAQNDWIDPKTAMAIGAVAALSSKGGAKVAQSALVKRSDAARELGQKVLARRRLGGMFAAPFAISAGVGSQ